MDFAYTAINASGAMVEERLQADSEDQALRQLQSQGCTVLALKPAKATRRLAFAGGLPKRAKLDQVAMLSREFAVMVETGVPVVEALQALIQHASNPTIKEALSGAYEELAEGKTMAQALGAYPHVFPKLYVDMVRTAETGGSLDETLNQAADYLEAALEMRRKVVGALTYPTVLLLVAMGVLIFMLTYLVPQFRQLFERMSAQIPPSTQLLLTVSDVLTRHWWAIPIVLFGTVFGIRAALRRPVGNLLLMRLVMRLPVIGDVTSKVAMARILRALGTLTGAGVSLLIALDTAAQVSQNSVYEQAMRRVREQVEQGVSLTEAVVATKTFPPIFGQMTAVGEKSGRLSAVLLRIALYYERDVDARLKTLTSVIEPVMIVLLGIIVGFIAVSIITPIYSLVGSVK